MKKVSLVLTVLYVILIATGCVKQEKDASINSGNEAIIETVVPEKTEENVYFNEEVDDDEDSKTFTDEENGLLSDKIDFVHISGKPISLTEDNYGRGNWKEIEETFSEVYVKCMVDYYQDNPLITELYYYGITKDGDTVLLGSYTKDTGLLNSNGQEFAGDREFRTGNDFYKERLLGLSVRTIDFPISLKGMALSTDNEVYETETLCRLAINCDEMTIEEWFPDL